MGFSFAFSGFMALLVGCGTGASNPPQETPDGVPLPGATSDLRQLRYELTYQRDARLRTRHRGASRDIGEYTFQLSVSYDALVELAPPPPGTAWPEILPTGIHSPVRGGLTFSGVHHFIEDAGRPPSPSAHLQVSGTFIHPDEITITLTHLLPYTDHYHATVSLDLPVRTSLTGPMEDAGTVATMMHSPFSANDLADENEPGALRLITQFLVYPRHTLPRPSGIEGSLHDMQARTIPSSLSLGALLGVAWQGAALTGHPHGDWTYTLQGSNTTGGADDHEFHDRVSLTISTVPVTLGAPGSDDRP